MKDLPNLIDAYVDARNARLSMQKEVNELQQEENKFKAELIERLKTENLVAAASATSLVKYIVDDKPIASDWDAIYEYIMKNEAFDLLQRRLLESAIKSRWEDGVEIPGVATYPVDKLTISKV